MPEKERLLIPGRNCWRLVKSRRTAFLVDGEAYFAAFASAVAKARRSVLILGWDIDSRIRLWRDTSPPFDLPAELGEFLNTLARRRRGLHIHVLDWDFALLYSFEREALPLFKLGWQTHRRLHFALDSNHPVGASHHQKIVVVDDRVAFVGGFDLAKSRWDTSAHRPGDERRVDNGSPYPPFHDVQMLVEGEAAAALGDLARQRWRRATGEELSPPKPPGQSPWPDGVEPDLGQTEVAIARTDPGHEDQQAVQEVKALGLDAIAAARHTIYIENQYLTAPCIGEALEARLQEDHGPEVILVLPRQCSGWLEETTMGVLRARLLGRLRQADRHDRLKVYYPTVAGLGEQVLNVHAKVLVVDDRLLRVGSSNLNNRSLGLDTECDLALEAASDTELRAAIARFRNRLVAEHLGAAPEQLAEAIDQNGSLVRTIEALRGGGRSLEPLADEVDSWLEEIVPEADILDPERPVRLEEMVEELIPEEEGRPGSRRGWLLGLLVGGALALAAAWRWTPLGDWLDLQTLLAWGEAVRESPAAPWLVLAAYLVGGLVLVPVTLLILATALTFGPWTGFAYALLGCLLSALTTYGLGRLLGREKVRRLAGGKLNAISRWLVRRGFFAVLTVRLVPVAPFSIVNLVAGASRIRPRDFFLGTLCGMGPGVAAMVIFEGSLERLIRQPQTENLLLLAGIVAALALLGWGVRRWVLRRQKDQGAAPAPAKDEP